MENVEIEDEKLFVKRLNITEGKIGIFKDL
jgi:hypothetical protein